MKKIILMLLLVLPIFVSAETFKKGDITYVLEERQISCLSDGAVLIRNVEDNLFFHTLKDNKDVFIKVNSDNECIEVSENEILSIVMDRNSEYYYLETIDNEYVIKQRIDYYDWSSYKKTTDTTLVEGKSYFKKDENGISILSEEELKVEDIGTYYEELFLEVAKNKNFDSNETYYQMNNKYELEIVENPEASKISSYYVESEKPYEIKTIETLDTEVIQKLVDSTLFFPNIEKIGNDLYILVGKEKKIDETSGLVLYDFYDINGNKIENITDITRISSLTDELVMLYKEDSVAIYDLELNKIYDIENINSLDNISYNNYVNYLISWDEINEKSIFYNLYEYKVLNEVEEDTNDKEITLKFSGKLNRLLKVYLNDKELDKENYTLESGSTIVTLKSDFVKTLKTGSYTLKVEYNDGVTLETAFDLKEVNNNIPAIPATLDNIYTYLILSILSMIVIVISIKKIKNRTN